jgi:hypothetical protein
LEEHLIDTELKESPKDIVLGIMRWWEKKRLIFNLIILSIVILAIGTCFYQRPNSLARVFDIPFFTQSLFYFIFINVCYCAGWGVQLLVYYYFNIQYDDSKYLDYLLLILGTLFTGGVTYFGYLENLMYGSPF